MNIAITVTEPLLESPIFPDFDQTPALIIVNVDTMQVTPIACQKRTPQEIANVVLEYRCEAVITGILGDKSFRLLADDGITRFQGTGYTAHAALAAMDARELDYIRNPNGKGGCSGEHGHGLPDMRECSGHTH